MVSEIATAVRSLIAFTVLTGVLYPLGVCAVAKGVFPIASQGSLVERGGRVVGSLLIAQKATSPRYFHPRPSAADYATVPSGASNQGPTSAALKEVISRRRAELGEGAPADLLMASASGLDPHVSPGSAHFQVGRVADARRLSDESRAELRALVAKLVEGPQLGILGKPRVNVLALNLALDEQFP